MNGSAANEKIRRAAPEKAAARRETSCENLVCTDAKQTGIAATRLALYVQNSTALMGTVLFVSSVWYSAAWRLGIQFFRL